MRIFRIIIRIIQNPKLVVIRLSYNLKRLLSDIKAQFGKYKYKYNIIFIAGMPMSATTWVKNMFGLVPGYYTRYTPMSKNVAYNQNISDSAFKYCPKKSFSLFKTHLNPHKENIDIIKKNNVKKIIVTYRDLRDVALSRYHRLIKFPKKDQPDFLDYESVGKEEGINHSIMCVEKYFIPWIKGWKDIYIKNSDFVLLVKFEDLATNSKKEFERMLKFYEISLDENKINQILDKTKGKGEMVKNMKDSTLLPWAISTNFRSGKIGAWKSEFSDTNKIYSKKILGKYLIELGYERNESW
jgi:hypothetical protein